MSADSAPPPSDAAAGVAFVTGRLAEFALRRLLEGLGPQLPCRAHVVRLDIGQPGYRSGIVSLDDLLQGVPVDLGRWALQPLRHQDPYHPQRERAVSTGPDQDLLVRPGRREGLPRADVDEPPHAPIAVPPHPGQSGGVSHGLEPGLQDIGAHGDEQVRAIDVVEGENAPYKGDLVRPDQRLVRDGLVVRDLETGKVCSPGREKMRERAG